MFKVGDKIWLFSENRRVYEKDGVKQNHPIYSEHFYEATIESETSRSWIVNGEKYSKKDPRGIYNNVQKLDAIWDNVHRRKIINYVDRCSTEELKQINELFKIIQ